MSHSTSLTESSTATVQNTPMPISLEQLKHQECLEGLTPQALQALDRLKSQLWPNQWYRNRLQEEGAQFLTRFAWAAPRMHGLI